MIYITLAGLYIYLIIKTCFKLIFKNKQFTFLANPKLYFLEIIGFGALIGYFFNFYYFHSTEYRSFIVSPTVLWISFITCILTLGVGIGTKFTIDRISKLLSDEGATFFAQTKNAYNTFSHIWINLSIIFLSFIYCIMEISKPSNLFIQQRDRIIIYILSFLLGLLFAFAHFSSAKISKRINILALSLILACLIVMIFESSYNMIEELPTTTSFILFLFSFLFTTFFIFLNNSIMRKLATKTVLIEQTETSITPVQEESLPNHINVVVQESEKNHEDHFSLKESK